MWLFGAFIIIGGILIFIRFFGGDITKEWEKEEEFKKYYNYVMAHGTEEQKQTAILLSIKKDLQGIKALAGLDLFLD